MADRRGTARRPSPAAIALQIDLDVALALHALLDDGHVGMIVTDADGRVTHWSSSATQLYGWEAADAVGRHVGDLGCWADHPAAASPGSGTVVHIFGSARSRRAGAAGHDDAAPGTLDLVLTSRRHPVGFCRLLAGPALEVTQARLTRAQALIDALQRQVLDLATAPPAAVETPDVPVVAAIHP